MRATLHGTVKGPVAAVAGAWEPFLPEHRRLLVELAEDARRRGLSPVAIMLDPPPALLVHGARTWPLYDDAATRLALVRSCPLDAVLLVRFARADIDAGAADFFDLVRMHVRLRELWLGRSQSFGQGPKGNQQAIAQIARRRRFDVRVLEPVALPATHSARESLSNGRLADAIRLVGRSPTRRRPRGDCIHLDWATGRYAAVPATADGATHDAIAVDIGASRRGGPALRWPDREIVSLAFVKGPGDAAPAA